MNLIPVALAANTEEANTIVGSIPGFLMNVILGVIGIVITFFVATFLRMWAQRVINKKKIAQHEEMRILYGRVVFTSTFTIGVIISLTVVGAPLELFTGGIGLGVAFAFRGILANFFAGMMLLSNNKFNIGDYVMLNPNKDGSSDISGTIVDIQSRATSLRAVDGGEITVPNMKMIDSAVKCFTKNPIRRHAIEIGVGYKADIPQACELLKKTITANENVQPEPPVNVLTKEISDHAIILEARFWTESKTKWWIIKSEITKNIFDALGKAGIDVPYPIQTLRIDEHSSDLLAKNPHLLENLENIEQSKPTAKKPIFKKTPFEAPELPKQSAPAPVQSSTQTPAPTVTTPAK
jgi:small conductance mechanosensitive channel